MGRGQKNTRFGIVSYEVIIPPEAQRHILLHLKSGQKGLLKKIDILLAEIAEHPHMGTGKPEQLRHKQGEYWSRRIDDKHRLVYEIVEQRLVVIIVSSLGHYTDK